MRKTIFILSLALTSLSLYSQESNSKVNYKTNGFWDNWFVNLGGGGSMYFGDGQEKEADFAERLTWGANASIGKWITPVYGARLTFQGGQKHTFNERGAASNPGHMMATGHYLSVHADALLNFSNLVAGYREDRFYNFIPYIGVGVASDQDKIRNLSGVGVVGLLNTFRVTDGFAITLDISGQAVQSKFNDARFDTRKDRNAYKSRQDWDGIGSVTVGVKFGLGGKQKFETAETVYVDNTDPSLIAGLNNQINSLNSENENLRRQLEDARNAQGGTTTTEVVVNTPYSVQFQINRADIEPTQEVVIYNIAQFLKNNPDTAVDITGYADKQTGTPAINEALSKRRVQAVENRLVSDYGISKNRIISSWKGDKVQPYPTNDWNRVVVIKVTDK